MSVPFIHSQQDLLFTQQQFSRGNINPAGVGNTADLDLFLLGRLQWLGVDDAPHTILLNATKYIPRIQSGIGITLSYDAIGIGHHTTEAKAEYSYQFDLSERWVLSLGASAGVYIGACNPNANTVDEEQERGKDDFPDGKEVKATPDFNVGLELTSLQWTFGVSCTHIENSQSTSYSADRHWYAYMMRAINLVEDWDLMATLAYMNRNKVHLADAGILVFYRRMMWGGMSWRPDLVRGCNPSYLSFMVGFEWRKLRFGYLYECGVGSRSEMPSNTHEVLLGVRIGKN